MKKGPFGAPTFFKERRMDWTTIVVALLSMAGTAATAAVSIKKANNLTLYRLEQLEEKVSKHNNLVERMYKVEERAKSNTHRLDEIVERLEE